MGMSQITAKSQKGQQVPDMSEAEAREYIERLLWPDGKPICRHCGSANAYKMQGKSCRPGLCRCRDCKKQFTVTVGTIFEDTHIKLSLWVKAIHLLCSSKKGMSALQLQRNLGIGSYRTAWFMSHRIRWAMRCEPLAGMLTEKVEADETYVGGKPRKGEGPKPKAPVMVLVESRPGGRAHAAPIANTDAKTFRAMLVSAVQQSASIITDEHGAYPLATASFAGHYTVNHSAGEYSTKRFNPDNKTVETITTNTAESYFSLLKRGIIGTFHKVSKKHLFRYCDEFSFRWNGRTQTDVERRESAIKAVDGKRLMYRQPIEN